MTLALGRPEIVGSSTVESPFPIYIKGLVVKGFGRGSKELGIPTANLSENVAQNLCKPIGTGIYFGWASVGTSNERYAMVMSLGWNPYYHNEILSAEVHIIQKFEFDFYGEELRVVVLGFIRSEKNYDCLQDLIDDIQTDIRVCCKSLDRESYKAFKEDVYLAPSLS